MKTSFWKISTIVFATLLSTQCKNKQQDVVDKPTMSITKAPFGSIEGKEVSLYTLENTTGMQVGIINYGGRIVSLQIPDKYGKYDDVVLGFDSLDLYLRENPYFGALIGRYGNRIAKGTFTLDGQSYQLPKNDGQNHLHGGPNGFDKVLWEAEMLQEADKVSLTLTYVSKDMEEGYPGQLTAVVTYSLDDKQELTVHYEAQTDKTTIVNLTQHSYFNLSGDLASSIADHQLQLDADAFLPVDATLIPTGEIRAVEGTPFDFKTMKPIQKDIEIKDEQLQRGLGYDHCWILNNSNGEIRRVAALYHEHSGRLMEVFTDQPGIQFYSGNFLNDTYANKNGGHINYRSGLCLETQHYPDAPNHPAFPSVVLRPGEIYKTTTSFKFSVK